MIRNVASQQDEGEEELKEIPVAPSDITAFDKMMEAAKDVPQGQYDVSVGILS